MPRYYFHVQDGQILHDETGLNLPDLPAAQNEALRTTAELLKGGPSSIADFWKGKHWQMWVTDKPNGEGKTLFTLRFSAEMQTFN